MVACQFRHCAACFRFGVVVVHRYEYVWYGMCEKLHKYFFWFRRRHQS